MRTHPDLLGLALTDYHKGKRGPVIYIHSPEFDVDEIDPAYYFRSQENMPHLERLALSSCYGKILDAGAGAGCHSLLLQKEGKDVVALDMSPGACKVMKDRGVRQVVNADIYNYTAEKPDTLLMLMNGIGLFEDLASLDNYLAKLRGILAPGGQFLFDSTNLVYIFEEDTTEGSWNNPGEYYGEIQFRMEYENFYSPVFRWLYIDFPRLQYICSKHDLKPELMLSGENYDYLARIRI